jgi:hypothetical protein
MLGKWRVRVVVCKHSGVLSVVLVFCTRVSLSLSRLRLVRVSKLAQSFERRRVGGRSSDIPITAGTAAQVVRMVHRIVPYRGLILYVRQQITVGSGSDRMIRDTVSTFAKGSQLPRNRDLRVYRQRAELWRVAAAKVPPGATQDAYLMLAEGYTELADFIELDRLNQDISADRPSDG